MKSVVFVGLLFFCLQGFTQSRAQIRSDGPFESISGRPGWGRFTRNVVINYQGMRINCDYLEINQHTQDFEARENLRIRTKEGAIITGLTLTNDPRQNTLTVNRNVIFTDVDSTQLFTDRLVYNRITEVSTYTTGGRIITSDSTVLTSKIGHYHGKTQAFHCKTDVVIVNPSYTIHTDTMQMVNNVIRFFSPTHVWTDSNYMYCEKGWYKIKEEIASLVQNAFIQTPDHKMYGDSIYYEMKVDFGQAFENVVVIDSARDVIVYSDFAQSDRRIGEAWFTKNPVGIMINDGDSLFVRGDTLRIVYDTSTNDVHHMLAYYNVRFFRHDMQGAGDSMSYEVRDSILTMFGSPIVWSGNDQLTADTIRVFLSNNRPQYMHLLNRAFIASKGYYEGHFNQVKGWKMIGVFNDSSELERVKVYENAETVYFVIDDADTSLIGILKVNSDEIEFILEDQAMVSITYYTPEDGAMYPEWELPVTDRFLKGFLWQDDRRPKSKFDIWTQAPQASQPSKVPERTDSRNLEMLQQTDFGR
ncbi:MAG: hypothetical protein FWE63_02625 [Bacteroidales bacterium]|nr:hypothetical protein [Bacteroidales bacterium]